MCSSHLRYRSGLLFLPGQRKIVQFDLLHAPFCALAGFFQAGDCDVPHLVVSKPPPPCTHLPPPRPPDAKSPSVLWCYVSLGRFTRAHIGPPASASHARLNDSLTIINRHAESGVCWGVPRAQVQPLHRATLGLRPARGRNVGDEGIPCSGLRRAAWSSLGRLVRGALAVPWRAGCVCFAHRDVPPPQLQLFSCALPGSKHLLRPQG